MGHDYTSSHLIFKTIHDATLACHGVPNSSLTKLLQTKQKKAQTHMYLIFPVNPYANLEIDVEKLPHMKNSF